MYLLDTNILSELVKRNPNRNLMRKLGSVPRLHSIRLVSA